MWAWRVSSSHTYSSQQRAFEPASGTKARRSVYTLLAAHLLEGPSGGPRHSNFFQTAQTHSCKAFAVHALQNFACLAAGNLLHLSLPVIPSCPQPVEAGCHEGLFSTWHPGGTCRPYRCQAWSLHASPSLTAGVWHLQVVKKIWEYIKEHNLQNPKNKRKIIVDDNLGADPRGMLLRSSPVVSLLHSSCHQATLLQAPSSASPWTCSA